MQYRMPEAEPALDALEEDIEALSRGQAVPGAVFRAIGGTWHFYRCAPAHPGVPRLFHHNLRRGSIPYLS